MKKKILIRTALGSLALVFILFGVLVVHIYQATHAPKSDLRNRQLSRIDFKQQITDEQAGQIESELAKMDGIEDTHFNKESGILIYTYAVGTQTSENVYNHVMKTGNYKAEKYMPSAQEMTQGCPAIGDKDSWKAKFTSFIANL